MRELALDHLRHGALLQHQHDQPGLLGHGAGEHVDQLLHAAAGQADLDAVVAGGRLLQAFMRTRALRRLARAPVAPDIESLDDEGLVEDFRQRGGTVFHPVSTCRMAGSAADGVVDARLRVFGIQRLRVVDASAFPNLTSGNTNAPTLMLAHRAAGLILASP